MLLKDKVEAKYVKLMAKNSYDIFLEYITYIVKGELTLIFPKEYVKQWETKMRSEYPATYMKYTTILRRDRDLELEKQVLEKFNPYYIVIKDRWYEFEPYLLSEKGS
jgi:hypothetical protein